MSLTVKQPTDNETPDTTQGGGALAVTSPSDTGHGSTTVVTGLSTCRWFGLQNIAGVKIAVRLKADWARDGSVPAGTSNSFTLEYSVNNGSSWATAFQFLNVAGPASGSVDIPLTPPQDVSQIQIRDNLTHIGILGSVTGSISNIRLDVTTQDPMPIVLW